MTTRPNQLLMESRFQELKAREQAAYRDALDLIAAPDRYRDLDDAGQRAVLDRMSAYLRDRTTMPADVSAALDKKWEDGETVLGFCEAHAPRRPDSSARRCWPRKTTMHCGCKSNSQTITQLRSR